MSTPAAHDPTDEPRLGALLRLVWERIRAEISEEAARSGYDDLRDVHLQVFRYPSPEGLRPTELAAQLGLSKQSANDLVGHLERTGYLVRRPDPADGRARVMHLTARGRRLERTVKQAADAAEKRVARILGAGRAKELKRLLSTLARDLDDRDERKGAE